MRSLAAWTVAVVVFGALVVDAEQETPKPERIELCRLQEDRPTYNHKVIDVGGLVEHAFEHFVLSDSKCAAPLGIWLEYGGDVNSDTVYCCGTAAGERRRRTLVVEGITLPLVNDSMFKRFDDRIRKNRYGEVKFLATLRGHFFAGKKDQRPGMPGDWGGYGHLGCCSLLIIQQVLALDGSSPIGAAFGPS